MKLLISLMLLFFSTDDIDLKLDLEVGEQYTLNSETEIDMTQEIQGMNQEVNTVLNSTMIFNIKDRDGDRYKAEIYYESLTMNMNLPMQQSMVLTSEEDKEGSDNIFSEFLKVLIDKPFEVSIDQNGKVHEVSGLSGAFDNTLEEFDEKLSAQQINQLESMMAETYSAETFKSNVELITRNLPEQPVALQETWTTQMGAPSMEGKIANELMVNEYTDDYILISGDAEVDVDEQIQPGQMPGAENASFQVNGTVDSSIKLDPESNWVSEAEINQELEGVISVEDAPQMPEGMEIPTTISISANYSTDH